MVISAKYQTYLYSKKWKVKRRKVLSRAKYKCERCKKRQATQVHHLTYKRIFNEKLSDLMAVCAKCHMEIHGIKEKPAKRGKVRMLGDLGRILARVIR